MKYVITQSTLILLHIYGFSRILTCIYYRPGEQTQHKREVGIIINMTIQATHIASFYIERLMISAIFFHLIVL